MEKPVYKPLDSGDYIDVVRDWLQELKAVYLAKEDQIVYYTSLTGRNVDKVWIKLSLREVQRIIKATKLPVEEQKNFKIDHIVSAAQELGVVYHFGVKSQRKTLPHIFNYLAESVDRPERVLMSALVDELCAENKLAFLISDVDRIYSLASAKLGYKTPKAKDKNDAMFELFNISGYSVRIGRERVNMPDKTKKRAIIKYGHKPSDIEPLTEEFQQAVARRLFNILK